MHHNGSTQVTTNPGSWLIFQQMLTIAARKVDSYFNDVAIVDAACLSAHNPADRFYWMIDVWGSHWGAANPKGIESMQAAVKVFGYRDTLEYYIYDPRTGLVKSTKEHMRDTLAQDSQNILARVAKPSTALPLPVMPKRLLAAVKEIRAKDAALNRSSHNGRYFFEETMLAWTAPRKFYATVRSMSWEPSMWPADNHLYFLLAAKDAFKYFKPEGQQDQRLPETYIFRKGRLEPVTMQEMQTDIAREIACRRRQRPQATHRTPKTLPVLPTMLPAAQPALFNWGNETKAPKGHHDNNRSNQHPAGAGLGRRNACQPRARRRMSLQRRLLLLPRHTPALSGIRPVTDHPVDLP